MFLFWNASHKAQTNITIQNAIKQQDKGLIFNADKKSPRNIAYAARVPPQPGQGTPTRALKGHTIDIGINSEYTTQRYANVNIIVKNIISLQRKKKR